MHIVLCIFRSALPLSGKFVTRRRVISTPRGAATPNDLDFSRDYFTARDQSFPHVSFNHNLSFAHMCKMTSTLLWQFVDKNIKYIMKYNMLISVQFVLYINTCITYQIFVYNNSYTFYFNFFGRRDNIDVAFVFK